MNDNRSIQREKELKKYIGEYLVHHSNRLSLITVTRVTMGSDSKHAQIYVSVLPTSYEGEVIKFLERNLSDMQSYLRSHLRMGRIPFLSVHIDEGEKNRQRIDELLREQ